MKLIIFIYNIAAFRYHLYRCHNFDYNLEDENCEELNTENMTADSDLLNPKHPLSFETMKVEVEEDLVDYVHTYVLQVIIIIVIIYNINLLTPKTDLNP